MDASSFQRLGDEHFASCSNLKFKELKPMGLVRGKRTPRKSTPDTLIELINGKFVMVEYTTKDRKVAKKSFLKKLREDLLKCVNPKLTGIPIESVETIVLATNQLVSHKDRVSVTNGINEIKNIVVEFRDIDYWSLEVRRFSFLGPKYLKLPTETKQVLTIDEFIKEYERGGLSTPTSNKFLHRRVELSNALKAIDSNDTYVLSGPPGVGKTRIALEAASRFTSKYPGYKLYCLKDKGSWSLEDVHTYLIPSKKYLLVIDDANRHLKLLSMLISSIDEGSGLKLLLTVRDYALPAVKELFGKRATAVDVIPPFEEKELLDIIYQVANFTRASRRRILELANGNARLALMAALIIRKTNILESVSNASELFEQYFDGIVNGNSVLSSGKYTKALGLLAPFRALEQGSSLTNEILKTFAVTKNEFIDAVHSLEEFEMAEVEGDLARISEQNFQTFLFYKAFISEKKLPLSTLLKEHFPQHKFIIKEAIVSAINAFGYQNLHATIYPTLVARYKTLKTENDKLEFFESFWYYCPTELFAFAETYIAEISKEKVDAGQRIVDSYSSASRYFRILTPFLNYDNENFRPALELLVEFVKRNPDHYTQLVNTITGNISYDEESYPKYTRQQKLLSLLVRNLPKHNIYSRLFFDIANHLLYARFTVQTSSYKRNTIALEQHRAILNGGLRKHRKTIWNTLHKQSYASPSLAVKTITHYCDHRIDLTNNFINYDSEFIFKIIQDRFDHTNLNDCLCVVKFEDLLRKYKVEIRLPEQLENKFTKSPEYIQFRTLSWYRDYEKKEIKDIRRFRALKSKKIIDTFNDLNSIETEILAQKVVNWNSMLQGQRSEGLMDSMDILTAHTILNKALKQGLGILRLLTPETGAPSFIPYESLKAISANSNHHEPFLQFLKEIRSDTSLEWFGNFLMNTHDVITQKESLDFLFSEIDRIESKIYFDFAWVEKLSAIDPTLNDRILTALLGRWTKGVKVVLSRDFFKKAPGNFSYPLIEEAYIMQYLINAHHFDFSGEAFRILITANDRFLMNFCKKVFVNVDFTGQEHAYFIKGLAGSQSLERLTTELLDFLSSSNLLYSDDFYTTLYDTFNRSDKEFRSFVSGYLLKNVKVLHKVAIVFQIVDKIFKSELVHFLKVFLRKNSDVEIFKKVVLPTSGTFFGGSINISEIHLSRWMNIKSVIAEFDGIKYLKHRQFIDEMVYYFQTRTRDEAKELFLTKAIVN